MIKNVLLPLLILLLTSVLIVYFSCYFNRTTQFTFLFAIFGSYGICSNSIFNQLFSKIFPDPNNSKTAPVLVFIKNKCKLTEEFLKIKETKAFQYTAGCTLISVFSGGVLLYSLSQKYEDYQLEKYGKTTYAVVHKHRRFKHGSVYKYDFEDASGKKHSNLCNKSIFSSNINDEIEGDTVRILYSTERPDFSKIIP